MPEPEMVPKSAGRPARRGAAVAVIVAWVLTVVASYWISVSTGVRIPLCVFRRLTGYPCATCGGTRSAIALLGLDPATAWSMNPLVTTALVLAPIWTLWRFTAGRRGAPLSRGARRTLLILGLAAFATNWVYVIRNQKEIDARPLPRMERFFGGGPQKAQTATPDSKP